MAFSTHSTRIARRFLATGAFDLGMFSLNPMYDYTDASEYGKGEVGDRFSLYREFEQAGVGISVMKAFAGGPLQHELSGRDVLVQLLGLPGKLAVPH